MHVTVSRIKAIIAICRTDNDVYATLKAHRIKYRQAHKSGALDITIISRSGIVRIYRTCSKSFPFAVHMVY